MVATVIHSNPPKMLDITFRPLKDRIFNPLCTLIPHSITPAQITFSAFLTGLLGLYYAATSAPLPSVAFWLTNRALDCLDGALARHRNQASDLGGFFDLLCDFVVYSGIPIGCALGIDGDGAGASASLSGDERGRSRSRLWLSVAVLEATFHVNNFVLFYIAAVLEKRKAAAAASAASAEGAEKEKTDLDQGVRELTSVAMRPALIEGLESGVLFTVMLAVPRWTELVAWGMAAAVCVGIVQRTVWIVPVLRDREERKRG